MTREHHRRQTVVAEKQTKSCRGGDFGNLLATSEFTSKSEERRIDDQLEQERRQDAAEEWRGDPLHHICAGAVTT